MAEIEPSSLMYPATALWSITSSAPDEYLIRVDRAGAVEYQLVRTVAYSCWPLASHANIPSNEDLLRSPCWCSQMRSTGFAKRSITLRALIPLSIQLVPSLARAESRSS